MTASLLNGRANPRKTAPIEARFDNGDELIPTGRWSQDCRWVEVYGGETGTVWVKITYVSERKRIFTAVNADYGRVKIRKRPMQGKITGYIKKGETVIFYQSVLGWGKCSKGWVDLSFLTED